MSAPRVTIVDYGIGNLFSVQRALEICGAEVTLSGDSEEIAQAPCLVLPGVGAFADGMAGLRQRGLVEPLRRYARSGRPLLGICLGMQMLATSSEEFGDHEGLDLIPGRVLPVPRVTVTGEAQKIPHIGWSELEPPAPDRWASSPLRDTPPGTAMYLVHSFAVTPDDPQDRLADCVYGGHRVCAAIRRGRVVGCQFHPEKSGRHGLRVLARFLEDSH